MRNSIYPCLWFENQASEAAKFYCGIFKNSKITMDTPMVVNFELDGKKFMGLNGGPQFKFNEAISFVVDCEDQKEVDYYWLQLMAGGRESRCGWLKDKFGLSWQIVPKRLGELMQSGDPKKSTKVMEALMKMIKINIAELEKAFNQ